MNRQEIISSNSYKLANRLYEIDRKMNKENVMLVDEYNAIVEELWGRIPEIKEEQLKKKENQIKPQINVIKFDVNWLEIKNLCRATINMGDSKIEPKDEWKKKLLIAEHSPLRHSLITIELKNIPYYVSTHLVRHHQGVEKYIGTSRSDRTGVDRKERKQTDLVTMRMDLNIQSLINISRKRLCNCADKETQKLWLMVVREIAKYDENIAWACVPEGIFRGGCPENFSDCTYCNNMLKNMENVNIFNPIDRYNEYHKNTQEKTESKQLKKILLNDFDKKREK